MDAGDHEGASIVPNSFESSEGLKSEINQEEPLDAVLFGAQIDMLAELKTTPRNLNLPKVPSLPSNLPNSVSPTAVESPRSPELQHAPKKENSTTPTPSVPIPPVRTKKKRTVVELKCSEVRWFYRKSDADKWIPFNGHDSLVLEWKYRVSKDIPIDEAAQTQAQELNLAQRQMIVVLEGLYKLDADNSKVIAIYWKDDQCDVRRGTWFTSDMQPLEAPLADSIERHHLQYFRGQAVPDGLTVFSQKEASNKPQLTELHLDNIEIRWSSVIDINFTVKRGAILRYIGWNKSHALRRGYEKEAEWEDAPSDISHLILVVHGIGQKGYENLIAQNCQQVRDGVIQAIERNFPEEKTRPMFLPVEWRAALILDDGITEQITLQKMSSMRTALNSTAMDIMYYQSPLYRKEIISGVTKQLNKVYKLFKENNPSFNGSVSIFAHSLGSVISYDILTNWSPLVLYDKYVTEALDEQLEKCNDKDASAALSAFKEARNALHEKLDGGIRDVLLSKQEQLEFKIKYLYGVGSPLGVFLVMRGATYGDLDPQKVNVERIFNVFHPYDPVAYRLEPLFAAEWKNIRPLKLFSYNDLRGRNSYDELPLEVFKQYLKKLKNQNKSKKNKTDKGSDVKSGGDEEDEEDECDSDDMDARSGCSSPRSLTPPPADRPTSGNNEKPAKKGWFSFTSSAPSKKTTATVEPPVEVAKEVEPDLPLADQILGSAKRPTYRIDFQVQPALTDKSYWSVLKSHFSYWTNADLALFLANTMYAQSHKEREIEKEKEKN